MGMLKIVLESSEQFRAIFLKRHRAREFLLMVQISLKHGYKSLQEYVSLIIWLYKNNGSVSHVAIPKILGHWKWILIIGTESMETVPHHLYPCFCEICSLKRNSRAQCLFKKIALNYFTMIYVRKLG